METSKAGRLRSGPLRDMGPQQGTAESHKNRRIGGSADGLSADGRRTASVFGSETEWLRDEHVAMLAVQNWLTDMGIRRRVSFWSAVILRHEVSSIRGGRGYDPNSDL
jgi:hypothetical protein